jgi:hypothetical protein
VDVVAAFVADAQAAVLVQPGDRALDHPTLLAEPGTVLSLAPGDPGLDAATAQLALALAGVVGAVAVELAWSAARAPASAAHRRDRVHQRDHLRDVVTVAAGQRDREWRAAATSDQVVL